MDEPVASKARVAAIGGGILGLRGYGVTLFERGVQASGASIRNFGMIWPVGQPAGEMHSIALRSREIWLEALAEARLPFLNTGSLHIAYHDDKADVLREFSEIGSAAGYACEWLEPAKLLETVSPPLQSGHQLGRVRAAVNRSFFWRSVTLVLLIAGYSGYYLCRSNFSVAVPMLIQERGVMAGSSMANVTVSWGWRGTFLVLAAISLVSSGAAGVYFYSQGDREI
jgi:hypothetical protein